ncbi:hypothetical protein [Rhizobium jaguaris]|uniref:Uncharacterized protein n=1 Tax=Rhizobium jaguaris TaxID=1312183 RepID=A0A387G2G4_9HYPH|nr:hypothetical protein [Rhizobium jaguaris]AYG62182.1 hypothetical protein CCGE525_25445 [Rhizobium jaguaris]
MHAFDIVKNVRGRAFAELINELSKYSDVVGFVLREQNELSDEGSLFLEAIKAEIINEADSHSWPGTILLLDTARVVECKMSASVVDAIRRYWDGFFDGAGRGFPEDIFMKDKEGTLILETVGHERYGLIRIPEISLPIKTLMKGGYLKPMLSSGNTETIGGE